ncbi:MAG: ABC transporter ATP-binding protein [Synergistaceae bacterium]|jgi:simple sugar transport system ATP-binding protein|nr:ABC transporter ATP-binding protein [Synergistaceae bacterium]
MSGRAEHRTGAAYAVEMLNIRKEYPGVVAADDASLYVKEGEIHGLIGENGAGKSTMMNILYGMIKPDRGIIRLYGRDVVIGSPRMAIEHGISMVHQHFMLMPNMSVLRNVILGRTPVRRGLIDVAAAKTAIGAIMEEYDLHVDLDSNVYQLSVGEKQRVEIIKALYRESRILILDEPTAVLTPSETNKLMEVLTKLKNQGRSLIFITHKLREVMALTDNITVMRRGVVTGRTPKSETEISALSTVMVGREVDLEIPRKPYRPGECVLDARGISALNSRGLPALRDVSLTVNRSEIVGIAGVEGNGQSELVEVIAGMLSPTSGSVIYKGTDITGTSVRYRRENGISHVPEDRLRRGVAKTCTVSDNLILNRYYQKGYAKMGIIDNRKLRDLSERLREEFAIKTPDTGYKLSTLSGGNMQKVVFARETQMIPDLLIAAQPSRGIDIGAMEYIHGQIIAVRDSGRSVLLVSAELDEILSLSDRILVMYEGRIVARLPRGETDEREIGEYMMGARSKDGEACA